MAFVIASVALGIAGFWGAHLAGLGWMGGIVLGGLLQTPLLLATLHHRPGWLCPTVCHGPRSDPPRIALTFDDGPDPIATPRVLELLRAAGVHATFFVIGSKAARYPELVQAITAGGHELGNHSYLHPRCIFLWGRARLLEDTARTQTVLQSITAHEPRLYRPPVGFRAPAMRFVLNQLGLVLVNFDMRVRDLYAPSPEVIVKRVMARAAPGSIVALHDGADRKDRADRDILLRALPVLVAELKAAGFSLVRVSELLSQR